MTIHFFSRGMLRRVLRVSLVNATIIIFFIADDLVLNPVINERNYAEYLQLGKKTCFLPGLITLHERKDWWPRVVDAFRYRICYQGVEAEGQLPSYEEALKKFKRFGLQIKPLRFEQIWNMPPPDKDLLAQKYNLSYPLVGSYSDIFVISATNIRQFCHYCGVFAATRLFVEVGLPTAVVLSAENIVQESDLSLQGKALWTKEDYNILENYRRELKMLLDNFPANFLYLHPIKLSVWNTKSI
ncbi:MAG: hypothetical protein MI975_21740 [Cytophagales bacterium]|nr:hypothetical protein [Cytophagales bacterium]